LKLRKYVNFDYVCSLACSLGEDMIKNSPLFIQKITTLTLFSLFFSLLISFLDQVGLKNESSEVSILAILIANIIIGLIFFTLIYFLSKRKNIARFSLILLLVLGVLAYVFSLIVDHYSIFQGSLYILSILIDVYTLILLIGSDVNSFIKSGYVKNEVNGSYKAWLSVVSSILFIMVVGAKFLNKYDSGNQDNIEDKNTKQLSVNKTIENHTEYDSTKESSFETQGSAWEDDPNFRDEGIDDENNSDQGIFSNKLGEGQPIEVRFSINTYATSLYDKETYNIVIQAVSDKEVTIYDVILNRGNKCRLSEYDKNNKLPTTLRFGEYTELSIGNCDAQMVREIVIKTDLGNYQFGSQS